MLSNIKFRMELKKKVRFYIWFIFAFFKKNASTFLLSALISFLLIIGILSTAPLVKNSLFIQTKVEGISGNYFASTVPLKIKRLISSGLVYIDKDGNIVPALSNSWEMTNSFKEFRFHLKRNLRWPDGSKFTSQDINYHFKGVQIKRIDDYTVYFLLSQSLPIFPIYLTQPLIKYPVQGIMGLYNVEKVKYKGEYVSELYLSPNKHGIPYLVYKFYPSEADVVTAYKLSLINFFLTNKKDVKDQFAKWKNTVIKQKTDYNNMLVLFFNEKNSYLKIKDIRKALCFAINKKRFVSEGLLTNGPIPPTSWAFNPNLKEQIIDPDRAKNLIERYNDKKPKVLKFYTTFEYISQAEKIKKDLQKIGLKSKIYIVQDKEDLKKFDLLLALWKVPSDPDQYYFWHSTQDGNLSSYNNPKVDKLLENGRTTLIIKERKDNYFKFQEALLEDPPADFLYFPYLYEIKKK